MSAKIPLLLNAYRTAAHESTFYTPATMLLGHDLRVSCEVSILWASEPATDHVSYIGELRTNLERMHEFARQRLASGLIRMKTQYDAHATTHQFSPVDKLWL